MLHSIFAMEVAARLDAAPNLVRILRECVTAQPAATGFQQKWQLYKHACNTLLHHLNFVERGCWDYYDDDARALKDFDMWTKGMTTEEGARTSPSGMPAPYRPEPRYLTFTMAFLIIQESPSDQAIEALCNFHEGELWHRKTFATILQGLGVLNFASVKADVVYLIPRDEDWGLTVDDLAQEKFAYLRPVIG